MFFVNYVFQLSGEQKYYYTFLECSGKKPLKADQ